MRIKCHSDRDLIQESGFFNASRDKGLVAEMNSIKIADGHDAGAGRQRGIVDVVKHLHEHLIRYHH
jgi:hypothetical protein